MDFKWICNPAMAEKPKVMQGTIYLKKGDANYAQLKYETIAPSI